MASGYEVSVTIDLEDKISGKLKTIKRNMDNLISAAQRYNTLMSRNNFAKNNNLSYNVKTRRPNHVNYSNTNTGMTNLNLSAKNATKSIKNASNAQGKLNYKIGQGASMMASFKGTLKDIIGLYAGFEIVSTALNWSDEITLTQGKLRQLTDDVEGFMNKTYQMSQDTRTSYMDNASQMAKMWQLTGGTDGIFDNEDKLIAFNELLNKSFVLGGSGTREINASMYQLTQALSSGRLQGDELRSLAENAPYLINTITNSIEEMYNAGKDQSEWIDLTYNDLKKLGAEGVLTSEVITNAVLRSADDIRAAYENITPTWEQTFQTLKNQVQKISEPILKLVNQMINSESFQKFAQAIIKMFAVAMAVLVPVLELVMSIGEYISDHWSTIEPLVWGIVGGLVVFYGAHLLIKVASGIMAVYEAAVLLVKLAIAGANIVIGHFTGYVSVATGATLAQASATWGLSAATWSVIAALSVVGMALLAVIGVIYLGVAAYNKLTGSAVSATGIIVGSAFWLWEALKNIGKFIYNDQIQYMEDSVNKWYDVVYRVKNGAAEVGKFFLYVFKGIAKGYDAVINVIIDGINWLIDGINKIPYIKDEFGTVSKLERSNYVGDVQARIDQLDTWQNNLEKPKKVDYSDKKYEYGSLTDAYNKGYKVGADFVDTVKNWFNTDELFEGSSANFNPDEWMSAMDGIPGAEDYFNSVPNYSGADIPTTDDLSDDILNAINKNTDEISGLGKEELKYLRDIAEQKVINRFTTAEIKVTNNMTNNINSDRDIDGMADYFAEVLMNAANTTAEKINTTG